MASQPNAAEACTPPASIALVGHHQSGKSTIVGHLLVKLGALDKRGLERLERETSNRPAFRFAWAVDRLKLERDRTMTCDLKLCRITAPAAGSPSSGPAAASGSSATAAEGASPSPGPPVTLTLVDTPGHADYLRNTIAAITQSDLAVLVVDSRTGVMESPAVAAQTRDLALLALNLANYRTMVVAVNHMDVAVEGAEGDRSQQRYAEATAALAKLLKRKEGVTFVPVSGLSGDNLLEPSPRLAWWSGPTLLEAVVAAAGAAAAATGAAAAGAAGRGQAAELPLRMPIIAVYKVGGIGTVPAGRLAAGRITRGAQALLLPPPKAWQGPTQGPGAAADTSGGGGSSSGQDDAAAERNGDGGDDGDDDEEAGLEAGAGAAAAAAAAVVTVRSIESFQESVAAAVAGDFVGLSVKGVGAWQLRRGCVVCGAAAAAAGSAAEGAAAAAAAGGGGGGGRLPQLAAEFTAKIQVLRDPTSKREGHQRHMRLGYVPVVHVHTAHVPCRLAAIQRCNNKGEVVEPSAQFLKEGDIAVVQLVPLRPLVVEPFKDYPQLGRFAMSASMRPDQLPTANGGVAESGGRAMVVAIGRVEHVKHYVAPAAKKRPMNAKRPAPRSPRGDAGQTSYSGGEAADSAATTAAAAVTAGASEPPQAGATLVEVNGNDDGDDAAAAAGESTTAPPQPPPPQQQQAPEQAAVAAAAVEGRVEGAEEEAATAAAAAVQAGEATSAGSERGAHDLVDLRQGATAAGGAQSRDAEGTEGAAEGSGPAAGTQANADCGTIVTAASGSCGLEKERRVEGDGDSGGGQQEEDEEEELEEEQDESDEDEEDEDEDEEEEDEDEEEGEEAKEKVVEDGQVVWMVGGKAGEGRSGSGEEEVREVQEVRPQQEVQEAVSVQEQGQQQGTGSQDGAEQVGVQQEQAEGKGTGVGEAEGEEVRGGKEQEGGGAAAATTTTTTGDGSGAGAEDDTGGPQSAAALVEEGAAGGGLADASRDVTTSTTTTTTTTTLDITDAATPSS